MNNLKKFCLLTLTTLTLTQANAQTEAMYYTSMGNFKVRLTDALTPRTVDSFIARVSEKFYDGLIFHRVIDNFMIQGGDPLGTGSGGPGYMIPDEFHSTLKNVPGALAMANAGPNTNGCQFYINLVTNSHLDNHYTVFGMVINNFTVVQDIGNVPTNSTNRPLTDVVIDSIRITNAVSVRDLSNYSSAPVIYPNPSNGLITIDLADNNVTSVQVSNILGQVVRTLAGKGKTNVNLSDMPAGTYLVRMANDQGTWECKLTLQ